MGREEATPRRASIRTPSTYEDEPWRSGTTGFPLNQPWTPRPATPSARGGVPIELFPNSGASVAAARPTTAPSHGATTGALAFVTPRILNRPIRAPTHTNLETAELQYQREQHRLDVKRQLAQEGHARRNGGGRVGLVLGAPPENLSPPRTVGRNDFLGTYDPVKGEWLYEDDPYGPNGFMSPRKGRGRDPGTGQRVHTAKAITPLSPCVRSSRNPVMSAWIPEAPQQQAGRVQGRQVVKPASLGVYNPITNQWVVPPADPRYYNREQKLY